MAFEFSNLYRQITRVTLGKKEAEEEKTRARESKEIPVDSDKDGLIKEAQQKENLRALEDKQFLKEAKVGFALPEEKEQEPEKSKNIDPVKLEMERRDVVKEADKGIASVAERGASPEREFAIKERESAQKGDEASRMNLSDKKGKEKSGPEREEIMATDKEKAPKPLPEGLLTELEKQKEKLQASGVRADQVPGKSGALTPPSTPGQEADKGKGATLGG